MEEQFGPFHATIFPLMPGVVYLDVSVDIGGQREVFHSSHGSLDLARSAWTTFKAGCLALQGSNKLEGP